MAKPHQVKAIFCQHKVPVRLVAFFIGLLFIVNGWAEVTASKDSQEDSIKGLSCLERNNNDGVEELWLINFQSEKISHWDRMDVELKEYPITRVNQKTIAWTEISDVHPDVSYVYVLDRKTLNRLESKTFTMTLSPALISPTTSTTPTSPRTRFAAFTNARRFSGCPDVVV